MAKRQSFRKSAKRIAVLRDEFPRKDVFHNPRNQNIEAYNSPVNISFTSQEIETSK